ncbi:MAG: M20/M25/M40 family metallo-hydrolase [Eubacterium sp.]
MYQSPSLESAIQKLSEAIQIKTISSISGKAINYQPFDDFILFLERAYPRCHSQLEHTRVNNYGLVYRMKGKNRDAKPLLFLGHYDVAPVDMDTESKWNYSPFSGTISDGYIWGRGALDDKFQIIALFETLELFLSKNQQPERDVYLAFGFDEEVGGNLGANRIASFFKVQNLEFECILDEGSMCIDSIFPPFSRPLALVGVGEKGQVNLRITTTQKSGHAALPNGPNAIHLMSKTLTAIEENPMPPRLIDPIKEFLKKVSSDIHGKKRPFYDHINLMKPVLYKELSKAPMTNAMIRSTITPTMIKGSDVSNVVPLNCSAILNCRLLHGDTVDDIIRHISRINSKIALLDFEILMDNKPSLLSSTDSAAYRHLEACISVIFPSVEITPSITPCATDALKYESMSRHIYRFTPVQVSTDERGTMHNINERISFENLSRAIGFYTTFIHNYI